MRLVINHERRILELWFAQGENPNAILPPEISPLASRYRQYGYLVCMYHSGSGDVTSLTSSLLAERLLH